MEDVECSEMQESWWMEIPFFKQALEKSTRGVCERRVHLHVGHRHIMAVWWECTQEQNEIIFVPSGWYHQVHNLNKSPKLLPKYLEGLMLEIARIFATKYREKGGQSIPLWFFNLSFNRTSPPLSTDYEPKHLAIGLQIHDICPWVTRTIQGLKELKGEALL